MLSLAYFTNEGTVKCTYCASAKKIFIALSSLVSIFHGSPSFCESSATYVEKKTELLWRCFNDHFFFITFLGNRITPIFTYILRQVILARNGTLSEAFFKTFLF